MVKIWLKNLLKDKKLKHADVSDQAGISRAYFTQIVDGKRCPTPKVAKRIAAALDFPDEWYKLLDESSSEQVG
jgi:transcriptional regulator with XRE-family HTH domain